MQDKCREALTAMENNLVELKKLTKGLVQPKTVHMKSRNKKNSKSKAKSRKKRRLSKRIEVILKKIGKGEDMKTVKIDDIDDQLLASLHKRFDINPLRELLNRKIFIGAAAGKVENFLKDAKAKSQEASESDSSSNDSLYWDSDDE